MLTTFELQDNRLTLIHSNGQSESFEITASDVVVLHSCAENYQQALEKRAIHARKFLEIGTTLSHWLNRNGWLARLIPTVKPVWTVVFKVPHEATEAELAFLNAPWELLVWNQKHLAVDIEVRFNPIRQLGEITATLPHSKMRLNLVFMSAAPETVTALSYEKEEAAILQATQELGMDWFVEETGTLRELAHQVSRYQPDVVHISCHGGFDNKNNPVLALEDEEGYEARATATDWLLQPSLCQIKLAFISACHTAQPSPKLTDSFATQGRHSRGIGLE